VPQIDQLVLDDDIASSLDERIDAQPAVAKAERSGATLLKRKQIALSAVLLGLSWADCRITDFLIKKGYASEGNSLIRPYIGDSAFMAIKLLGTLIALLILWDVFRKYPKPALALSQFLVAGYSLVVWWNVYLACRGLK
jgi:hypothetical protein